VKKQSRKICSNPLICLSNLPIREGGQEVAKMGIFFVFETVKKFHDKKEKGEKRFNSLV
jgi:hypothetical protein